MTLRVVPITLGAARAHVERHHSHHGAPVGGLLACAVAHDDRIVCVAILGRPVARKIDDGTTAEVTRLASDGTRHAASMCLAAVTRAAIALGYRRLVSYTLLGETGTSYRAAGWRCTGLVQASQGWLSRPGRTIVQSGGKARWETGPDASREDADALAAIDAARGCALTPREETLPLFREARR